MITLAEGFVLLELGVHQLHGTRWWLTLDDYRFRIVKHGVTHEILVPAGYRYDRSTIPWELLISKDQLGCKGALVHDFLYGCKGVVPTRSVAELTPSTELGTGWCYPWTVFTREEADELFRVVMLADNVLPWRAWAAWATVRIIARRW